MLKNLAFIMGSRYLGGETQENAKCCHCGRTFLWDEYTCDIYRGKLLCSNCLDHYYGNCDICGELNKYEDMDEDIICKACKKKEETA